MTIDIPDTINMYSLTEQPFGRTWEEWTIKWWQWFLAIPKCKNPAHDETGKKNDIDQIDPDVWFLAGTTGGTAERTVTVPGGKALLFPVINVTASYSENPDLRTEEELTSYVNSHMDDIVKKEAYIDGVDLNISENHRVQSPPFDFSFPDGNIYAVPAGCTRGAGDGYWLFLKPLSPGKHHIKTFGSCQSGIIQIGVSIHLIVKDTLQ